jgi:hypothetical protein
MNFKSNSLENMPGGHTRIITDLKRILKVTEYLGGETVQRRAKKRVVEYFVELCQVGIEWVQGVHK